MQHLNSGPTEFQPIHSRNSGGRRIVMHAPMPKPSLSLIALAVLMLAFLFLSLSSSVVAQDETSARQDGSADQALAERAAVYTRQIGELQTTLANRAGVYADQLAALDANLAALNDQLSQLRAESQTLTQQQAQIEAFRAERSAQFSAQLDQARQQYDQRAAAMHSQLVEAQARLAEANQLLGR